MGSLKLFPSFSLSVSPATNLRRPLNNGRVNASLNMDVEAPNPLKLKSNGSNEVIEKDAKFIVATYARAPVVLSSGKGCKLYDPEGESFLIVQLGLL